MESNLMKDGEQEARAELLHGENDKKQEKNQQIRKDRKVQNLGAIGQRKSSGTRQEEEDKEI